MQIKTFRTNIEESRTTQKLHNIHIMKRLEISIRNNIITNDLQEFVVNVRLSVERSTICISHEEKSRSRIICLNNK